jgi:hypothetical protein
MCRSAQKPDRARARNLSGGILHQRIYQQLFLWNASFSRAICRCLSPLQVRRHSACPDAGKERSEESRPRSSTRRINRLQVFAPVAADFSRAVCRCRCLAGRGFSRDRNPAPQRRTLTSRESRRPPDAVRARRCLSPLPLPLALRRHSACPDAGRERSEESLPFKVAAIKSSAHPRRNKPPYESSSSAHGLSRAKQNALPSPSACAPSAQDFVSPSTTHTTCSAGLPAVRGGEELSNRDDAQVAFFRFAEHVREGFDRSGRIFYSVVENDDRAGLQIFGDEPADVP